MRLLRPQDVDVRQTDRVFRHARVRALIVWLLGCGATAALLLSALAGTWPPGFIFGPFLLLYVLITFGVVRSRFRASNWLVRMNDTGIFVQLRSYLNSAPASNEPSVLFLPFDEIASARLIRERVDTPRMNRPGVTESRWLRYVELEVSADTSSLAAAAQAERARKAPPQKRWYGTSATLYRDYPVTVSAPGSVRVHWDVVPGARTFLDALRPYTTIADPVRQHHDFTRITSLGRAEQEQQIRDLVARGDTIAAIYAARRAYGGTLAQARDVVESLQRSRAS
jgi:hypothetical protein